MTTVVVAEKPSVARDIARVLGARRKAEGHLEGNGYLVTWALGHLVHFAEPDEYGPQWSGRWAASQLPMIPEHWQLKTQRSTVKQFQVVKRLINGAGTEQIVCATDAGREGENIFRLIYEHARCRKPVQRLWVSSLTDEAIREGFRRLRPGSAYDDLGQAARGRAQADWLVGMNLTRAYTVHNRVLCTIGRVQTPTLAMIVQRDAQIASFRKAFFYELVAALKEGFPAKYSRKGQTRIDDKAEAERLHRALSPNRTGTVRKIEKKIRRNRPPPLYDLTNLQRDANRRFGFTIWKRLAGHKLRKKQVEQLLREGRTGRIEGFTSKAGKPFAAALKLGQGLKVEFDFADGPRQPAVLGSDTAPAPAEGTTEGGLPATAAARPAMEQLTCPKCGQGRIIEGRRGFGCNRYREGCDFVVWKEIGGKRLTEKQVYALIGKGKTGLLKGFKSKSGKKFDARLRLDPQWRVAFEFPVRKPRSMGREKS